MIASLGATGLIVVVGAIIACAAGVAFAAFDLYGIWKEERAYRRMQRVLAEQQRLDRVRGNGWR